MDAASGSQESRSASFPHYDQPWRGLPAELRLEIWRHALTDELKLEKTVSCGPKRKYESCDYLYPDGLKSPIGWSKGRKVSLVRALQY